MGGFIFAIAIIYLIAGSIARFGSETKRTAFERKQADKYGRSAYYDAGAKAYRVNGVKELCIKYSDNDEDGWPYDYFVTKSRFSPRFVLAEYYSNPDKPVKYRRSTTDRMFENHWIKSTDDLYRQWGGKRPWQMPKGFYSAYGGYTDDEGKKHFQVLNWTAKPGDIIDHVEGHPTGWMVVTKRDSKYVYADAYELDENGEEKFISEHLKSSRGQFI